MNAGITSVITNRHVPAIPHSATRANTTSAAIFKIRRLCGSGGVEAVDTVYAPTTCRAAASTSS